MDADKLTKSDWRWLRDTLAYASEGWTDRKSIKRRDVILRKIDAKIAPSPETDPGEEK